MSWKTITALIMVAPFGIVCAAFLAREVWVATCRNGRR